MQSYFKMILVVSISLVLISCNKKTETKPDLSQQLTIDEICSDSDTIPKIDFIQDKQDIAFIIIKESQKFVPSNDAIKLLQTPEGGLYSSKKIELYNINCHYVIYTSKDSSDVRIFWTRFENNNLVYAKQIAQWKHNEDIAETKRKYIQETEFRFYHASKIVIEKEQYSANIVNIYTVADDGHLQEMDIPPIYKVWNNRIGRYIENGKKMRVFDFKNSSETESTIIETASLEYDTCTIAPCSINEGYAIEEDLPFRLLPHYKEIEHNLDKYTRLEEYFKDSMEDDAVAQLGTTNMEIFELQHNATTYHIYKIISSFRHGIYTWLFITINNDLTRPYLLASLPGSIEAQQIFTIDNQLFIYTYYEWSTAFGESDESRSSIFYLSPQLCTEMKAIWY